MGAILSIGGVSLIDVLARPVQGLVVVRAAVFATVLVASIAELVAPPENALAAARPKLTEYPASDSPAFIVAGPDGNMWFTSDFDDQIGKITPTGAVTLYPTPATAGFPLGIDQGPDGNLWFVEAGADKVGKITVDGTITEFALPTSGSYPRDIAQGPDGNLWFTELYGNRIGKITPDGAITEYPIPTTDSRPVGITAGPDGRLWFTEADGDKLGRVTTGGTMSELRLPGRDRNPIDLALGPDGNMWVTEPGNCCISGYVSRITVAGDITEFPIDGDPATITSFRGALWFTEPNADIIGQMSPQGVVSLQDVPKSRNVPDGIAPGPDGTLWFCENASPQVGKITFP
jgi:virginiamycin B lyase